MLEERNLRDVQEQALTLGVFRVAEMYASQREWPLARYIETLKGVITPGEEES
jgi:hypothetical protein